MFNRPNKKAPDGLVYSPDQRVADKNVNPLVGGIDWTKESATTNPPNPDAGAPVQARVYNPSERYFERHPEVLKDKPGVKHKK